MKMVVYRNLITISFEESNWDQANIDLKPGLQCIGFSTCIVHSALYKYDTL